MCHVSGVTFFLFYKLVDLVGGGSVFNGADPVKVYEDYLFPIIGRHKLLKVF